MKHPFFSYTLALLTVFLFMSANSQAERIKISPDSEYDSLHNTVHALIYLVFPFSYSPETNFDIDPIVMAQGEVLVLDINYYPSFKTSTQVHATEGTYSLVNQTVSSVLTNVSDEVIDPGHGAPMYLEPATLESIWVPSKSGNTTILYQYNYKKLFSDAPANIGSFPLKIPVHVIPSRF